MPRDLNGKILQEIQKEYMKDFFNKYKKILNILLNILLFGVLFYFINFKELINTFLSINILYLLYGIFFTFVFFIISPIRWESCLKFQSPDTFEPHFLVFVKVFFRKEFFSSFTSNLVGDVYSILAITHVTRKDLIKSVLIMKLYDVLFVCLICLIPLMFFKYINYSFLIILSLLFVSLGFYFKKIFNFAIVLFGKIHPNIKNILLDIRYPIFSIYQTFILIIYTILQWSFRALATYFALLALNVNIGIYGLLMITFLPIIFSLAVFILPKSISGDSATVAVGLLLGINYPILVGYVVIHRIYSLTASVIGFLFGFINVYVPSKIK